MIESKSEMLELKKIKLNILFIKPRCVTKKIYLKCLELCTIVYVMVSTCKKKQTKT